MIQFERDVCRDLDAALRREWLETNGLGGFASSTIVGLNTRRYHGILVAATHPPAERTVLLAKLEETLVVDGARYELSANRYPGVVHPQGYRFLKQFRLDPFPVFVYEAGGIVMEKSVFMVHGQNTTVVEYRLSGEAPRACTLEVRPLIAFRDYHATTHENGALDPHYTIVENCLRLAPYADLPPLYLCHSGAGVAAAGFWYRNFEYDAERARGLDYREDLFNPLVLTFDMRGGRADLIVSTEPRPAETADDLRAAEIARRAGLVANAGGDPLIRMLTTAADQFVVACGGQNTIMAGYHWFTDWGRDTMIALPGLTLATGRADLAKRILLAWAGHVDQGMLPNRFLEAGATLEYNTADATLWFFEAVRAVAAETDDYDFVRANLYDVLRGIVAWHERGTRFGIHVDDDGLIYAGQPGMQLTWMDAKVGDWVVTPRQGKPVEIQALWYNALRVMEDLAGRLGNDTDRAHFGGLAERVWESFGRLFWNEAGACLYDVIDGEKRDASIRPNQIFAISLFHKLLSLDRARAVVEVVERELLTPYGLRSLARRDPHYRGRYEGDPLSRDGAYHQGTVWPWLMGPFANAYLWVNGDSVAARARVRQWLRVFHDFMEQESLGQVPEVFDGDAPQHAGGCIAQAWSVAELLRLAVQQAGSAVE